MGTCIFCGDKGGSAEHIIAQWLIKRMGVEKRKITVAAIDGVGNRTERSSHTLFNYTTKNVCSLCNNGWMSELEVWFQRNMGFFVERKWPALANEHIKVVLAESGMLAAWCLKTALTMNNNSLQKSISDEEMVEGLRLKFIVNDVYVDMAYIESSDVSHIMSKGFRLGNGSPIAKWQTRGDGRAYTCIIQLNHLALRVYRCSGADPFYRTIRKRIPYRLYPATIIDPHTLDYRFDTLRDFEDSLVLKTEQKTEGWILPSA